MMHMQMAKIKIKIRISAKISRVIPKGGKKVHQSMLKTTILPWSLSATVR